MSVASITSSLSAGSDSGKATSQNSGDGTTSHHDLIDDLGATSPMKHVDNWKALPDENAALPWNEK